MGNRHLPDMLACSIFVPLNNTAFLCAVSTSRASDVSRSWIDSFSNGVDSPESMASLTMQVPLRRRMSAETVVSECGRASTRYVRIRACVEQMGHTDRYKITRIELVRLDGDPAVVAVAMNWVGCYGHGSEFGQSSHPLHTLRQTQVGWVRRNKLTCQTTVHSNMMSMNNVNRL